MAGAAVGSGHRALVREGVGEQVGRLPVQSINRPLVSDQVSDNRPENDRTTADGTGRLTSGGAARAAGRI